MQEQNYIMNVDSTAMIIWSQKNIIKVECILLILF